MSDATWVCTCLESSRQVGVTRIRIDRPCPSCGRTYDQAAKK